MKKTILAIFAIMGVLAIAATQGVLNAKLK